jgi:hypothetical protein
LTTENSWFKSWQKQVLLFSKMFRPTLGPTWPHIPEVLESLSGQVKHMRHKVDYSIKCEDKNVWSYTSISPYAFKACTWTTLLLTLQVIRMEFQLLL